MRFTPLFASTMSGSLGGLTAARGPRGHRLYGRRPKVRSDSVFQRAARQAFNQVAAAWQHEATAADRLFWSEHAKTLHATDRLGAPLQITGRAAYLQYEIPFMYVSALAHQGFVPVPSTRPKPGYAPPPILENVIVRREFFGDGNIRVDADLVNGDQFGGFWDMLLYISQPSDQPDSNCRKGYIFSTEQLGAGSGSLFFAGGNLGGDWWRTKYGTAQAGKWVGLKIVTFDGDFRISKPYDLGPFQVQP